MTQTAEPEVGAANPPASGRLRRALVLGLLTLPVVIAVSVDFPLCPTAGLFGIPCPGCGLTRATMAAAHGDFHGALQLHPLVFVVAPVYITVLGTLGWSYVRGGGDKPLGPRANLAVSILAIGLFVALFGLWIARFLGYFGGPVDVHTLRNWMR
ncbi:MAG: DUF2752 domain-containing protein [Polyangiaceae bacterium]